MVAATDCVVDNASKPLAARYRRTKARQVAIAAGRYRPRGDADRVRAWIDTLMRAGFSRYSIAVTSRVPHTVVARIVAGCGCSAKTEAKILAVTPARIIASRSDTELVPSLGTQRRVAALRAKGWGYPEQDAELRRLGCGGSAKNIATRKSVTKATYQAVCVMYERLSGVDGPNEQARRTAARAGIQPPSAWMADEIDDPEAQPWCAAPLGQSCAIKRKVHLDDLDVLASAGETVATVADRLGVSKGSVRIACTRAGQEGARIMARLDRNAIELTGVDPTASTKKSLRRSAA